MGRRGNTESLRGRVVNAYSASLCRRCTTLDDLREVAADHGLDSATQFGGLHGSVVGNLSDVGPAAQKAAAAFLARQRKHIDNTARRVAFDPTFKCQLCCSKSCRPTADDPHRACQVPALIKAVYARAGELLAEGEAAGGAPATAAGGGGELSEPSGS